MKKLLKEVSIWSLPFLALLLMLFFINIIKKDFIYGHFLHSTYKAPYNWFYDFSITPLKKFYIKLKNDNTKHLAQIKIYSSESNLNSLLANLPGSTKIWQKGKIIHDYNSKKLKNIKLRYRGDNPANWLLEKKSLRIKLKKSDMNGRFRYYDYIPFEDRLLTSYRLAANAKILAPEVRPVELLINEEKKGLYLEVEHLNENFLRRRQIMPVNFYKGENYNQETRIGVGENLYNNSGLWSKDAYFNFNERDDNKDLTNFLISLKKSKNDPESLKSFLSYIEDDYFGRYLAYLIISQDYHHTNYHNNRMILDPWKGKVIPVINDPSDPDLYGDSISLNFDISTNDLISNLNQNSKYIKLRNKYLYNFIYEDKLIDKEIIYLEKIKNKVKKILQRDPQYVNLVSDFHNNEKNYNLIDEVISKLKNRKLAIIEELNKGPKAKWSKGNKKFSIVINNQAPIDNIKLFFTKNTPDWVFIDENYNGKFDKNEIKYFKNKDIVEIKVSIYANRLNIQSSFDLKTNFLKIGSTKFDFITENGSFPNKIQIKNNFIQQPILIFSSNDNGGSQTKLLNKVIHSQKLKSDPELISGEIYVKKDLIFERPVKIEKGTKFYLYEKANIIFKNKVTAIGTEKEKIQFLQAVESSPWGTVALLGNKTSGSELNNLELKGGSGSFVDQYVFTSMLSIHDTSKIKLKNINLNKNYLFDDMMHIIYSNNIQLENLYFKDAFGDALDIDISKNILISDSTFENSKNDGIDLMESNVQIKNVKIKNSNDKGVSVGEASIVNITDSKLIENVFGVAVKDNSQVIINNSEFYENKNHISAYKKNLQYGSGGKAVITKSKFKSKINRFSSIDSTIDIKESTIEGAINNKGKNIIIDGR